MKKRNILMMLLAVVMVAACWGLTAQAASNFIQDVDDVHDGTIGIKYEARIYYYGYEDKIKSAAVSSGTLPDGLSYKTEAYGDGTGCVVIYGTPTKAGTYSFKITAASEKGKTVTSAQFTVTICANWQTFKLTLTDCTAKRADGTTDTYFRAGETVTLVPKDLSNSQFVSSWKNDAGLSILAGIWFTVEGVEDFSIWEKDTFIMPAKNFSIQCIKKNKDLGTLTLNPTSGTLVDYACNTNGIESMLLAKGYSYHDTGYTNTETLCGISKYYYVDLDKDGTVDLELRDYGNHLGRKGSDVSDYMKAMSGRSVYGTYTVEVSKDYYRYANGQMGLYSKIVLNMGAAPCPKSSSGHKIKGITAKAPTCTKDGYRWHYECTACGQWFADAEGKTPITNKTYYILKATGHKWSAWYVAKEATETEEGIKERVCYNNKNHKEQVAIPKLEPAPTEPPTTEAPTTEAPTTEAPTTEAPTTEAPTTEAPTTEAPTEPPTTEAPTELSTTEAPTEPETTEAPTEPETTAAPTEPETTAAPTEPETTAAPTEPETTAAPTQAPTEAPTQAPTEVPKPTEPAAPEKSGGNTILYVLLGVTTAAAALMGGILIGKKGKEKASK